MSAQQAIAPRLTAGRPLLLSADPLASLRAMGCDCDEPVVLGRMLRESASHVRDLYLREVEAGVDVIGALTTQTMPRSLAAIGMGFRAAALTSLAVDLALEVTERQTRPIAVAGVLGGDPVSCGRGADRLAEALAMHAARLSAAGCGLLIARGEGVDGDHEKAARIAAIASAAATGLPTWAVVHAGEDGRARGGDSVEAAGRSAVHAGASVLLWEVDSVDAGVNALAAFAGSSESDRVPMGVLLAAPDSSNGASHLDVAGWADGASRLVHAGARILGGGAHTTSAHLAELTRMLARPSVS